MCRAVWILVAAPDDDACRRLRRAAGPEAQVVAMHTDAGEATAALESANADAVLIGEVLPGAAGLAAAARARGAAVVWVGDGAPAEAHEAVPDDDALADTVPGALTKALLARR